MADTGARVEILWIPLGAGGHVVRRTGWLYERLAAWRERRPAAPLFHAGLLACDGQDTYAIEMAPVWNLRVPDRGAVLEGPVGLRGLGRWRLFRYEVRRWRGGWIPDAADAVERTVVSTSSCLVTALLDLVPQVPRLTWGRDELRVGEMWNSNSLVSWLLTGTGLPVEGIAPPCGGRAPGWAAGVAATARRTPSAASR